MMGEHGHTRRDFIGLGARAAVALGLTSVVPITIARSITEAAASPFTGLADPRNMTRAPKFTTLVPNALDPDFKYAPTRGGRFYQVGMHANPNHTTGLQDDDGIELTTEIFGYGQGTGTWPGMTFEVPVDRQMQVEWSNNLPVGRHPIWGNASDGLVRDVVDTSLHWCYSLPGYTQYTIDQHGVPVVVHVHGGHSPFLRDGNPEYFFSPGYGVTGPRWSGPVYQYPNDQYAGTNWYHDHALGITRLNVYAGLAGFFFLRDDVDTGREDNPLGVPGGQYEFAYAIQDRMFADDGRLFYPSYPDDPFWDDFIGTNPLVTAPSALAEFFGDHIVVNGKIWPKADVEARSYRIHLLNGCDSRFLSVRLRDAGPAGDATDLSGAVIPFTVIGSDQGLAATPSGGVTELLIAPGERYDLVVDFSTLAGRRIIVENRGGDEPFGGDIPGANPFAWTNRIMAFDVDTSTPVAWTAPASWPGFPGVAGTPTRTRRVALFEGTDDLGRLQPLLGTVDPAVDARGRPIDWPDEPAYADVGLVGQMNGAIAWHSPATENPALGDVEEWEVWNLTGDAHPVHLHLVHFEVLGRYDIVFDGGADEAPVFEPEDEPDVPSGTYLVTQPVVQHTGTVGNAFRVGNPTRRSALQLRNPVENAPKDIVTALPGQVTVIKARFDRPGRYVWHCHILSHEDHEMMRPLEVGAISGRPGGRP